jgi:hypothetical protein
MLHSFMIYLYMKYVKIFFTNENCPCAFLVLNKIKFDLKENKSYLRMVKMAERFFFYFWGGVFFYFFLTYYIQH